MARGRPVYSQTRQNIAEILYIMGKAHGYDIFKVYSAVFPKISLRNIYYQLKRGAEMGMFKIAEVRHEQGEYSWGPAAERVYYALGEFAKPVGLERVREHIASLELSEEA